MPTSYQTVQPGRGAHASPEDGACVMELCSMLSGEGFTDRPRAVSPVLAAFLRGCNDHLDDRGRRGLRGLAVDVLDTARGDEDARADRCFAFVRTLSRRRRYGHDDVLLNVEVAGGRAGTAVRRGRASLDEVAAFVRDLAGPRPVGLDALVGAGGDVEVRRAVGALA